jgi:catechol 2,3-dioxygenase-like lactoylglutathione lyase family enzyme
MAGILATTDSSSLSSAKSLARGHDERRRACGFRPDSDLTRNAQPLDALGVNLFQINVFVEDFDRMLRFYRDQLGFEVNDIDPGPPSKPLVNWASLRTGDVILELFDAAAFGHELQAASPDGREAIELAFIVYSVEQSRDRLAESGISCGPVVTEAWGRFAAFRDPEGNQLQIFEVSGPGS